MSKKMLIDATHPEETRVVVVDGTKVEEFDFESSAKRQLAGNIYLAKITRVEPSLQAAFVEYGGNRHGFLAFSEIHPDYYQIPFADREALIAAEEAAHAEEEADERRRANGRSRKAPVEDAEAAQASAAQASAPVAGEAEAPEAAPAASTDADAAPESAAPPAKKRARGGRRRKDAAPAAEAGAPTEAPAEAASAETDSAKTGPSPDDAAGAPAQDASQDASAVVAQDAAPGTDDAAGEAKPETQPDAETGAAPETPRGPASMAEGAGAESADTISEDYAPAEADDAADVPEAETASSHTGARRRGRGRRKRAGGGDAAAETATDAATDAATGAATGAGRPAERFAAARGDSDGDAPEAVESVGASDAEEDMRPRRAPRGRSYKIQEVIKVRQIMLVQVVKEERGNKGAALTTYLSLAGRYCVLMPNTARGGGISRKITSAEDRKKLKEIASEFEVPKGMGIIIRTAGSQRTRAEIKRDYEYLLRQWEDVRNLTLKSIAPTLIYEEGSLIKRSIRDLYTKDIDEVLVEGDDGYREAKEYMRMLMPSHAKNVKPYKETVPLFSRYQVENYLAAMFNPTVQLRSGGYIVIGVTEALVAIDVNSGRSTREGSIEETALKTNLEAADEVARQLRLRDLAGLIVIDFIDMDERRNNAAVEKRMKDRLSTDRARIQIGRISAFGLMEMSRQRLRPGMIEASTAPCAHCHGTGLIRSENSLALSILREVEEEGMRKRAAEVKVVAPVSVANFIINDKRDHLIAIEARYGLSVLIEGDPSLISPEHRVERLKTASRALPPPTAVRADSGFAALDDPRDAEEDEEEAPVAQAARPAAAEPAAQTAAQRAEGRAEDDDPTGAKAAAKRRRGRRGGRKRRRDDDDPRDAGQAARDPLRVLDTEDEADAARAPMAVSHTAFGDEIGDAPEITSIAPPAPTRQAAPADSPVAAARETAPVAEAVADTVAAPVAADAAGEEAAPPKPKRRRTRKAAAPADAAPAAEEAAPATKVAPKAAPAEVAPEALAEAAPADAAADAAATAETPAAAVEPAPAPVEQAVDQVVEETPQQDAPAPADPAAPKRRGWWSLGSR